MAAIDIRPLRDELAFGARVSGVTEAVLGDAAIRKELNDLFDARGLILFEDIAPSNAMQLAISDVFGELKDHPVKMVARVDQDTMPGVIEIRSRPDKGAVVEIEGKTLLGWLPWHFDHSYNNELNRAGVLRAVDIAPEGGLTGFADGIQLYRALAPELRAKIEGHNVVYTLDLRYSRLEFGKPASFRLIRDQEPAIAEAAKAFPRAIHPAVWTRASGEKVLHLTPWGAQGIEHHEDAEGDRLFENVCQEMLAGIEPYFHHWRPTDMVIWDNWRMLHCVTGADPRYPRVMHRTTIKGDYGLGYFENDGVGNAMLEMTV